MSKTATLGQHKKCRASSYIAPRSGSGTGGLYETYRRHFRSTKRQMKASPSSSGNVLPDQLQEPDSKKSADRRRENFDALVVRYYPAVYSFACRFTDDPRQAGVLTRRAFTSTRKQLQTCCDKNVLASILISNLIRAGCSLNRTSRRPANLRRGIPISGGVMVLTGEP